MIEAACAPPPNPQAHAWLCPSSGAVIRKRKLAANVRETDLINRQTDERCSRTQSQR